MKENCPLYNTNAELGILFNIEFKSKKKCCKKYKKKVSLVKNVLLIMLDLLLFLLKTIFIQ